MNLSRRGFAHLLLGAGAFSTVAKVSTRRRYGRVTVEDAFRRGWLPAVVLLDGRNVADDCVEVDDQAGYVTLMNRQPDGSIALDEGDLVLRRVYGRVEFIPA